MHSLTMDETNKVYSKRRISGFVVHVLTEFDGNYEKKVSFVHA